MRVIVSTSTFITKCVSVFVSNIHVAIPCILDIIMTKYRGHDFFFYFCYETSILISSCQLLVHRVVYCSLAIAFASLSRRLFHIIIINLSTQSTFQWTFSNHNCYFPATRRRHHHWPRSHYAIDKSSFFPILPVSLLDPLS